MLCTNIVLNVKTKKKFCTQHDCELVFFGEFNEQSLVILWVNTDSRMRASEKDLPVSC